MRRRNRKKKLNTSLVSPPLAGVAVVLVSLALGYASLKVRGQALGRELSTLEQRRDELIKQRENELLKWTTLKSPQSLERALIANGLSMTWPSARQVVRLRQIDVPTDAWDPAAEELLARREVIR